MSAMAKSSKNSRPEILLQQDVNCDMESLTVNGICVGFGNNHDNHCEDRLAAIKETLDICPNYFLATIDREWKYE
jgi:hypothetical protein